MKDTSRAVMRDRAEKLAPARRPRRDDIPGRMLQLQRAIGNRAVANLVESGRQGEDEREARFNVDVPREVSPPPSQPQPLDHETRTRMESRFNHDFGAVRVHADEHAATVTRAQDAAACTLGTDVFFGAGRYSPKTRAGAALLGHELTHIVQIDNARAQAGAIGSPLHDLEREAADVAGALDQSRPLPPIVGRASDSGRPLMAPAPPGRVDDETPTFGNLPRDAPLPGAPQIRLVKEGDVWYEVRGDVKWRAKGTYAFVIQQGEIKASKLSRRMDNLAGHTEAAGGGRVEFAGQVTFGTSDTTRGSVTTWTNASGHYLPVREFKDVAVRAGLPAERFEAYEGPRPSTGPQAQLPVIQPPAGSRIEPKGSKGTTPAPARTPGTGTGSTGTPSGGPTGGTTAPSAGTSTRSTGAAPVRVGAGPEPAAAPRRGAFLRGVAGHLGYVGASTALAFVEAYIKSKLDQSEIDKGIAARWGQVEEQIAARSAQIEALREKSDTEKVYAVVNVVVIRGRQFFGEGGARESAAAVDSIAVAGVSATEKTVEEHQVMMDDVLTGAFNHKTELTFSVMIWNRAQEKAEALVREQAVLAERLRELNARQPKPPDVKPDPRPTDRPAGPPSSFVSEPKAPQAYIPGTPAEGPIEEAARGVAALKSRGQELERQGDALVGRTGSPSPPTADDRKAFFDAEDHWRTTMQYMMNWFQQRVRTEAVKALKDILENPASSGPKLAQIRSRLGG